MKTRMITRVRSPAKVNLTFKVVRKHDCGFHDIETLMQAVTLSDWVSLSFSEKDELTCTGLTIPTDASNLAWKALELFRKRTDLLNPVSIHIEKNVPTQAGLGGGSSNAATTLFAINALFNHPVDEKTLQMWSSEIGSDVPFFFSEGTALCSGRGDIVTNCLPPAEMPHWIAKPKLLHLSTPAVYNVCIPGESLEPAAMRVLPELIEIKQKLFTAGFDHVSMTGSGSAFVCYGDLQPEVEGVDFYPFAPLRKKAGEWYT
ncbi:MAG: 4-(cytidine 5'-diphospho)-2-C-methyl-D-erythritol kinase [Chlamydiia bacterium]|nr:4-(cytidine 5'-diphospho)-2-C-methyl-D-erythritol kinase [Chlamydiia bacterium]HPE84938.1 4-(cytidine 5'-diphospho)-2-C-methyl-D-erythritol kinase [Chlamydiales bacterium]